MISFDVFDTLITRCTATPDGIYAIMQERLEKSDEYCDLDEDIRRNFYQLRIHAEELARSVYCVKGVQEITLDQIYSCLELTGNLSREQICRLIALEYSIEMECSLPIDKNIEKLKHFVEKGEKIVLISDMYLESSFIRKLLIRADDCFKEIPLYVSVDYGINKYCGKLYELVAEKENIKYEEWIHYGDNETADGKTPDGLGIRSLILECEPLMQHEAALLNGHEHNYELQLSVGIARYCRKFCNKTAFKMGSSVGAVILYPYIEWIIKDCERRKINRLYFVARDGYVMKKVADILIDREKLDIQTYYIYGSRRAWRVCSLTESTDHLDEFIWRSYFYDVRNLEELADIFQIEKDELAEFFPAPFVRGDWEMKPAIMDYCMKKLRHNSKFISYLCQRHKNDRQNAIEYLRQEIDCSDENFAFVELGGTGYTQYCLAGLMESFYGRKIHTYYFKMDRCYNYQNCVFHTFFPSCFQHNIIFEMLARAPHGQTIEYVCGTDGKRIPILDGEGKAIVEYGFKDYVDGIIYYTNLREDLSILNLTKNISYLMLEKYIFYITNTPDDLILSFFGDMPTREKGRGEREDMFAPRLTEENIRDIYFNRRSDEALGKYYHGTDLEYSLKRCTQKELELKEQCILDAAHRDKTGIFSYGDAFPIEVLGGRVALYAAGKVGTKLYHKMSGNPDIEVVLWVDQNYLELQKQELPVQSPQCLKKVSYDQIVVGVMREDRYIEIRDWLICNGIEDRKILWFNPWIRFYYQIENENSL